MEAEKRNSSTPRRKVRTVTIRFSNTPEHRALYEALRQEEPHSLKPSSKARCLLMMALGFRDPDDAMLDRINNGNEWREKYYKRWEALRKQYAVGQSEKPEMTTPQPIDSKPRLRLV